MAAEGAEISVKTGNNHPANGNARHPDRLHAVGPARPFSRRHADPAGGAAIWASISIRCAAAARICGRCQIEVSEGEFAKLGVTSKGDHLSDFSARSSSATPTSAA